MGNKARLTKAIIQNSEYGNAHSSAASKDQLAWRVGDRSRAQ
jgi:hypothetical protein